MATSVFWTRSSSAFSTSRRTCSCLAALALLSLSPIRLRWPFYNWIIEDVRLLGRVELQPAHPDGLPRFHRITNWSIQGRLPRMQEVFSNGCILVQSRTCNLLPCSGIVCERPVQPRRLFSCPTSGCSCHVGGPYERMWKCLVLGNRGCCGGRGHRNGEVGSL